MADGNSTPSNPAGAAQQPLPHPLNGPTDGFTPHNPNDLGDDAWLARAARASYGIETLVACLNREAHQDDIRLDGNATHQQINPATAEGLRAALAVLSETLANDIAEALDRAAARQQTAA